MPNKEKEKNSYQNIEPDPESPATESSPVVNQDTVPLESPVETEASECPGGFEFLSNWALDPLRRASPRNAKLIDISPAVDDEVPESVVKEETTPGGSFFPPLQCLPHILMRLSESAPVDIVKEPPIESSPVAENIKAGAPIGKLDIFFIINTYATLHVDLHAHYIVQLPKISQNNSKHLQTFSVVQYSNLAGVIQYLQCSTTKFGYSEFSRTFMRKDDKPKVGNDFEYYEPE